jgi:hypothetical protein
LRPVHRDQLYQPPDAHLSLQGSFQRFELVAANRDLIRQDWLRLTHLSQPRPPREVAISLDGAVDPNDGAIQCNTTGVIVGQDGNEPGLSPGDSGLTEDEVRRLVRATKPDALYLVVGDLTNPLLQRLTDLRAHTVARGIYGNFFFLASFQVLAFGQNANDWWAAFLGHGREIYFPTCSRGLWARPEPALLAHEPAYIGIDLRVDEARYIYNW